MGPSLEEDRRRHRTARFVAVASVACIVGVAVLVWVVGLLGREVVRDQAAEPPATDVVLPAGPPTPQVLADAIIEPGKPGLRLQLPIRREAVTGIGFGPRRESGVVELDPAGHRSNLAWGRRILERFLSTRPAGDLQWYRLGGGTPSMVVVGAAPGTDAYAPLDATVVAITERVVDGELLGHVIQLQPLGDGQTLVVVRSLDADPGLAVGMTVSEGLTLLGHVRDMEGAVDAPLSSYTHDSGSGVELYVRRIQLADGVGA